MPYNRFLQQPGLEPDQMGQGPLGVGRVAGRRLGPQAGGGPGMAMSLNGPGGGAPQMPAAQLPQGEGGPNAGQLMARAGGLMSMLEKQKPPAEGAGGQDLDGMARMMLGQADNATAILQPDANGMLAPDWAQLLQRLNGGAGA